MPPQENEKQRLLNKFAGNLPNKKLYTVVLIRTKKGVEREVKKKAVQMDNLNNLVTQLNKNIKPAEREAKRKPSQKDLYQNMVVIIDGMIIQDSLEQALSNIEPANIKSIEVKKAPKPITVYFKEGRKKL